MNQMIDMKLKIQDYDVVRWKCADTLRLHYGYKIGEQLVVCKSPTSQDKHKWVIYSRLTGKKFINANFDTEKTAIILAEFLNSSFLDYFALLTEYPEGDLASLTQYTIPDGECINELSQWLQTDTIKRWTLQEINEHIR